jgi:DNA-directed RNA polymerase specialized sigma24 family protein
MRREQSVSEPQGDRRARIAAQAGDSHAHEHLLMGRVPELRSPVREWSRDPSEPEDVAQDAFLALRRVRNPHRLKQHLSPLLRAIAGISDTEPNGQLMVAPEGE